MLVDDDPGICLLLEEDLKDSDKNFDVQTYSSAREALNEFPSFHPDILITDFQMPEMDGLKLIQNIKHQAPIPAILMSGRLPQETTPADQVIEKPFSCTALVLQIRALTAS